jgi:redox-sensitive bicupin YhaK (pirin superfamily)
MKKRTTTTRNSNEQYYSSFGGGKSHSISTIVNSVQTTDGEGFVVNRAFPTHLLSDLDPFLLLDEIGPKALAPGEAKGAPDHPHRGFETVTYMLEGRFEHKDSRGNAGKLGPGDVQWMTAGSGVVHSEMPEKEFAQRGGRLHGFQLWVNLPRQDKMINPRYQDIQSNKIPVGQTADSRVRVKVIAGEALGVKAVIETRTPIIYLHFTLQPGASITQPVPKEYNTFAYVIGGQGLFGSDNQEQQQQLAHRGQMIIFDKDGEGEEEVVAIKAADNTTSPLDVLLIAGKPLNEPIARYGPFVMNKKEEIMEAIVDYQNGSMGKIAFDKGEPEEKKEKKNKN